jgi:hypothetical protein
MLRNVGFTSSVVSSTGKTAEQYRHSYISGSSQGDVRAGTQAGQQIMAEYMVFCSPNEYMLCCPRCGGTGIYLETGGYTGTIYRCKKCSYRGSFIVEIEGDRARTGKNEDAPGEQ